MDIVLQNKSNEYLYIKPTYNGGVTFSLISKNGHIIKHDEANISVCNFVRALTSTEGGYTRIDKHHIAGVAKGKKSFVT